MLIAVDTNVPLDLAEGVEDVVDGLPFGHANGVKDTSPGQAKRRPGPQVVLRRPPCKGGGNRRCTIPLGPIREQKGSLFAARLSGRLFVPGFSPRAALRLPWAGILHAVGVSETLPQKYE